MKIIERVTSSRLAIYWLKLYSYLSLRLNKKERKNNWAPVKRPLSLEHLERLMYEHRDLWHADKYLDIISIPEKLQAAMDGDIAITNNCDCDEFARYCCEALVKLGRHYINEIQMQSVVYFTNKGIKGHFVCSFRCHGILFHIGNWGLFRGNKLGQRMYNHIDVAKNVASRANGTLITSWIVNHETLKGWQRVI